MNLLDLQLENIGPFKDCTFSLRKKKGDTGYGKTGKHLIVTGENGTGKSVIIDAIRTVLYGTYAKEMIERNIFRNYENGKIGSVFFIGNEPVPLDLIKNNTHRHSNNEPLNRNFVDFFSRFELPNNFIVDFWNSRLSTDKFELTSIEILSEMRIFTNPLSGQHKNIDVLKSIVFFDYLKDSSDEKDAETGSFFYDTTIRIINSGVKDAVFTGVSRKKLAPTFVQYDAEIEIDKLSSGSIYMMQRMLWLLTKAYAAHILNKTDIAEILAVPGMLLIDEAETHLHPKWQKVLFRNILSVFPNIQIIASTHSPFIVSSLPDAEIIVCKSGKNGCYIDVETENYNSRPIEEIIRTPLFDTDSFSENISTLLKQRKYAISNGDSLRQKKIEYALEKMNPEYFKYLKADY